MIFDNYALLDNICLKYTVCLTLRYNEVNTKSYERLLRMKSLNECIVLMKNKRKGEDGHQYLSIRVKEETVAALNSIADKADCSRNFVINQFLEYGITHFIIEEK